MPLVKPSKAGIFLDQEMGEVSFYNKNDVTFLYFNGYFTQALWPYFCAGTDSVKTTCRCSNYEKLDTKIL